MIFARCADGGVRGRCSQNSGRGYLAKRPCTSTGQNALSEASDCAVREPRTPGIAKARSGRYSKNRPTLTLKSPSRSGMRELVVGGEQARSAIGAINVCEAALIVEHEDDGGTGVEIFGDLCEDLRPAVAR